MPHVRSIHHINWVVRDLDQAAERFERLLGVTFQPRERLPLRGVAVRRVRLRETWLVLVMPLDSTGPVAQRLAERGEGVFLLSLGVDSLDAVAGDDLLLGPERVGLDGWRVADSAALSGESTVLQLCESDDGDRDR